MAELIHTPGQTDTQLEKKFGVRHQTINQACRELEKNGLLNRMKTQGPIQNMPTGKPGMVSQPIHPEITDGLHEEPIKTILNSWLQNHGWKTKIAWGKAHGIDILATKDTRKWIIEVKGCGSRNPMRVNYFLAILGETLQRMDDADAKYSIALPDMQQYRNLWSRLPVLAKERTDISAIFVSENGEIVFDE
jgi:hypothetical protein